MLCNYGCGREAKFFFKNGKGCCSSNISGCDIFRNIKSEKLKNRVRTEEHCENISKGRLGIEPWNKGKKDCFAEDTLKQLSKSHTGKKYSIETNKKKGRKGILNSRFGVKLSKDQIELIRFNTTIAMKDPERRRKLREANIGRVSSEESRKKISEKLKGRIPWNKGLTKETDSRLMKSSEKQKNSEFMKIHKEWMLNGGAAYMNSFIKNPSKQELKLKEIVKELYPNCEPQYPVFNYALDIALIEDKIAIEYDGWYHFDCQEHIDYFKNRQERIENEGWKFVRYTMFQKFPTKEQVENDINNVKGD